MPPPEPTRRTGPAPVHLALFLLLILLTAGSAAVGVHNALHQSQDFQWSGTRLLDRHIDPWAVYLQGDPRHELIGTQFPNYLPVLYVFMAPLGLIPLGPAELVWALCNLVFAVISGWLAARFYGLRGRGVVTLLCLFLMATPTRNAIGNGQQSLLILAVWCLALLAPGSSGGRAVLSGISYAKFNFAPPVFLYLVLRWGIRKALLSLVPAIAGAILVWLWLTGGREPGALFRIAAEPFEVAKTGFRWGLGDQNLMSVVRSLIPGVPEQQRIALGLCLALAVCSVVAWFAFRVHGNGTAQWHLTLMATMSYSLFNHHAYDGVVLLFPLGYALRHWRERPAQIMLALLAYLFYVERILEALHLHPNGAMFFEFAMLMGILALTYRLRETERAYPVATAEESHPRIPEVAAAG